MQVCDDREDLRSWDIYSTLLRCRLLFVVLTFESAKLAYSFRSTYTDCAMSTAHIVSAYIDFDRVDVSLLLVCHVPLC